MYKEASEAAKSAISVVALNIDAIVIPVELLTREAASILVDLLEGCKKNGVVIAPDPAVWLQVVAAGGYEFKGAIPEAVSDFLSKSPTGNFITATVVGTRVIALEALLPGSQDVLELDVLPGVVSVHKGLNVSIHMQDVAGKSFVQKLSTTGIGATRQFIHDRVLEVTKESALGSAKLSQNDLA